MSEEERENGAASARQESGKLRELTTSHLQCILQEHRRWVRSEGKEGARADLSGCFLRGADFVGAMLWNADLSGSDLRVADFGGAELRLGNMSNAKLDKANFTKANLRSANLSESTAQRADFRETCLTRVNFNKADLQGAMFTGADLRYADLTDAVLLDSTPLAGMNLTGTRLPADIGRWEALTHISSGAQRASKLFTVTIVGCMFCLLVSVFGWFVKEDNVIMLFGNNVMIPLDGFYLSAPILLAAVYFHLHVYLQRLWNSLALLPAIFPDGTTLDKKADPWLPLGYIRAHIRLVYQGPDANSSNPTLALDNSVLSALQNFYFSILAYWLVPITLFAVFCRVIGMVPWWKAFMHFALLASSIVGMVCFLRSAKRAFSHPGSKIISGDSITWEPRQDSPGTPEFSSVALTPAPPRPAFKFTDDFPMIPDTASKTQYKSTTTAELNGD